MVLVCTAMGLLGMAAPVVAEDSAERPFWRQRAIVPADQIVHGDYVAFAPRVVISGTVNGDVYAAGGRVLVDGVINGDLIAAGRKIILSGKVSQNARIAAAHVVLSGDVGRNVTIGAADIQLTSAGEIRGNVLAAGGDVELEGPINGRTRIAAGRITIADHIGRDVSVAGGAVHLSSKATVDGKLRSWGDAAPVIDDGATIRGVMSHRPLLEGWKAETFRQGFTGLRIMAATISIVSTLILGLVLVRLYPMFTRKVTSTIRERPLRALGWGTAALIGIPIVAAIFVVTLLGLPIGMILLTLYAAMVYLSRVYAMTWLGQLLLRRTSDSSPLAWSFVTGLALYAVLSLIPVVGEFITLATVLFGLGALLAAENDLVAVLRKEQIV